MNAKQIEQFLPEFWRETALPGTPVAALLDVMAGMLAPVERQISGISMTLDPMRAAEEMLPFLARMLGMDTLTPSANGPDGQLHPSNLRVVLNEAAPLLDQRGTPAALLRALALAVGEGFSVDECPDAEASFHIAIHCPSGTETHRGLIEAAVRLMKPAHVTHDLIWSEET